MRAESNHTRLVHASKRGRQPALNSLIFIGGLACLVIGLASLSILESTTHNTKVKGIATQLSASQLLAYVNGIRQESGIAPLIVHPALEQAATQKAAYMIEAGYWDHTDPNTGITPWQFIDATGYRYSRAGENLARDFDDSQKVSQAWMASPPHRANLLESAYTHTGIGIAYGIRDQKPTVVVVQLLATPLPVGQDANSTKYASTAAVTPQSMPTIVLIFSGGLLLVTVGFGLLLLSRHHMRRNIPDRPNNNTPPLHLWST